MAATIDKDLTTTLKAARGGKPMRFAFLPKGGEGKLLVGKKIPPQQIAETKKATGASSIFKGRCVGEDGTLIFYVVKEPPETLHGQLKRRLKDDAGLTCPFEIRVSADAEDELAEGEAAATAGAAAAPSTPDSPRAAWEKALAEVEPAYLQGLRDQPDKASALRAVMGFAQGKAQKEDFPGAIATLRKLAEQLGKTSAGNGGKTTPGPEPVNRAGDDLAAQWKKNLAEWTPAIKAALAAKGPNAAAIAKLFTQAAALAKPGGDMAQALAKLTECHALATGRTADGEASAGEPVAETAQPTEGQAEPQTEPQTPTAGSEAASPSPPPTGQPAPTDAAVLQAEYERRVLALEPKILEAEKTRKGQAKWLMLFMSAQDRGSEGEYDKAFQILDKLEGLLNAPTQTNGKAAAALQQWQAARTEVTNQLRKVQAEITKAKDTNSAGAVLRLESVVKNLAFEPSTQQDVVDLEGWIRGDDVITAVEEPNPWGLPVQIRERLLPVLAALKTQLQE
jgi:hypothetical protein